MISRLSGTRQAEQGEGRTLAFPAASSKRATMTEASTFSLKKADTASTTCEVAARGVSQPSSAEW